MKWPADREIGGGSAGRPRSSGVPRKAGLRTPSPSFAPALARTSERRKVLVEIRNTPGGHQLLAQALECRWRAYKKQLKRARKKLGEKTVHDLRVAMRRLMAHSKLIGEIANRPEGDRIRKVLKPSFKKLGKLRDCHVQLRYVEIHLSRPAAEAVKPLRKALHAKQKKAVAAVRRALCKKSDKLKDLVTTLEETLACQAGKPGSKRLGRLASVAAAEEFRRFVACLDRVQPGKPDTIHSTRVAFKGFRYVVESLSPEFTGLGPRQLRVLANYQRKMGRIQDLEQMRARIREYAESPRQRARLTTALGYVRRELRKAVRLFLSAKESPVHFLDS